METALPIGGKERMVYLLNGESAAKENHRFLMRKVVEFKTWLLAREALKITILPMQNYLLVWWGNGPSELEAKVKFKYVQRESDF